MNVNKYQRRAVEFADLSEILVGLEECHADSVTQYHSECALFGDAGPGQGLAIREEARRIALIRARIKKLSHQLATCCVLPFGHPAYTPDTSDDIEF